MRNSPRFLVGWAHGHKDIALVEDGSVRCNGSWKYSPERRNDANVHELQESEVFNMLLSSEATSRYLQVPSA